MPSLDDVKKEIGAEKAKVFSSVEALIGSPYVLAALLAAFVAFLCHLIYAPNRLPPMFDNFSPLTLGLPPIDFGKAGEAAQEAAAAAQRQGASDVAVQALSDHVSFIPYLNIAGLVASVALLAWNMAVMIKKKRLETARRLAAQAG